MSKIEKELVEATGVEPKKGEDRQDFLKRLANATADLATKAWDKLSSDAQDWYNDNADARNAAKEKGKELPDFMEFKDAEEEAAPRARRRSSSDDEPTKPAKEEKPSADKLEEGQKVKITLKRREIEGVVIENLPKKELLVVKDDDSGKEREIEYDEIQAIEVFHGTAAGGKDEPEPGPAEPAVGDIVELTNKRGKVFKGEIVEMTDDDIVIEVDGEKEDFARDRVESINVLTKAKGAAKETEKPAKGKGKSAQAEEAEKAPRARSADGVPIGTRIKQAVADNLQATVEEIAAILKKDGVDAKENTLSLNYAECHKMLKELHARDLLNVKKFKPMV